MKQYQVSLTKVSDNKNAMRTQSIVGIAPKLPVKNSAFVVIGDSLTPGNNARIVTTSLIKEVVQNGNEYEIMTQNSAYKVTVLAEVG